MSKPEGPTPGSETITRGGEGREPAARLVTVRGDDLTSLPLPARGEVLIGRASGADVQIDDPSISRRHALLRVGDHLTIEDLGSNNGTFLRGRRLAAGERAVVQPGELIDVGPAMLVVQGRRASASAADDAATQPLAVPPPGDLVVQDPAMRRLLHLVTRVAPGNISVLLLGETGVGKERFAHLLHEQSPRAGRAFVGLSCAALPEPLLESELFGFEKGAFTGAQHPKPGLFEMADGGTLFLDEVGELPASTQVKLLRVLETRMVQRLGALQPRRIDVRVIAATNRDLQAEADEKRFRSDLYFRLDGVSLVIPPLRERPSEIAPLVELFLGPEDAPGRPTLSAEALAALQANRWPGNVRQLRNVIERAVLLCEDGVIRPEHLSLQPERAPRIAEGRAQPASASVDDELARSTEALGQQRDELQRRRIREALERCGGNQGRAAAELGVSRRTLVEWLRKLGMPRPRADKA